MPGVRVWLILSWLVLLVASTGVAQTTDDHSGFVVESIRIEGLQRISEGTVFTNIDLDVGDRFQPARASQVIRDLYATGFFSDVTVAREGGTLILRVQERPAIDAVNITGNQQIDDERLKQTLEQIGLRRGRVFRPSLLESLELELQRVYFSQGRYAMRVERTVERLPRNRVRIDLEITEGRVARIKQINLVGNETFADATLLEEFELGVSGRMTRGDQYSKVKLDGDLGRLRAYYQDRGFLKFNIDSTQVSITPDRQDVYITINLTEGERYTVSDVQLSGDLVLPETALRERIVVEPGAPFSRKEVTESTSAIGKRLGQRGYAFANVNVIPEVDEAARTVALNFVIDPGNRVYVRRINFRGHLATDERVLRREMRQMEGALYDSEKLERSRVRIQRLSSIQSVNLETPRVPGEDNLVDVNVKVEERLSGQFSIGAAFSQTQGVLFTLDVTQNNFLGEGKTIGVSINTSQAQTVYDLSYRNPYYTIDGVSRGFNVFYRETEAEELNFSNFVSNSWGGEISYGIPLTEFQRINIAPGFDRREIFTSSDTAQNTLDFIEDNGDTFDTFRLNVNWSRDSRNRTVFPDKGNRVRTGVELATPGGDLTYYKLNLETDWFTPLSERLTFQAHADIGFGAAYGDTTELPFFERFFTGGFQSMRGFETNTLGPNDPLTDDPIGGRFKSVGGVKLLMPPAGEQSDTVRLSLFLDIGNVFEEATDWQPSSLRASVGVGVIWLSPVGALTFSLAEPLNAKPDDDTQAFQFSIGTPF
jgi:outer membrane protein insertion porin family